MKVLILGAKGMLGKALAEEFSKKSFVDVMLDLAESAGGISEFLI